MKITLKGKEGQIKADLDRLFLRECERRAQATREEMLEDAKRVVIGQPSHRVIRIAERLRRILTGAE